MINYDYDDPAVFSEKVCRHITDGGSVILRCYGVKKKSKRSKAKWIINSAKWFGHINDWNPIDPETPDAYHIGQFLLSPKARATTHGIEMGERYGIMAQDKDTSEFISQCIIYLGEDEDEDDEVEEETDPFKKFAHDLQSAAMKRVINELSGTVDNIGTKKNKQEDTGEKSGLIELTNGSWVTTEHLIAELNERRRAEQRLMNELEQLRDFAQKQQDSPKQGSGLSGLLQLLGNFMGAGGAQGNPMANLGGLMNNLGGLGGLDLGALLGGNPGVMRQPSMGTVGGGFPPMGMPTMNPSMSPMQPDMNPFAPLLGSPINQNFSDDEEEYYEEPVKIKKQKKPVYEEEDTVSEDKELLDELRPLASKIFDDVWGVAQQGQIDDAKKAGANAFIKYGKELGHSKMVLQSMCMDPDNMAGLLIQSLPPMTRMLIKSFQGMVKPIITESIKLIDWNQWGA